MKKFLLLILYLGFVLCSYGWACECQGTSSKDDFEQSDAVFIGNVVGVNKVNDKLNDLEVEFKVLQIFKGNESQSIVVRTNKQSTMCGYSFEMGRIYLVYAEFINNGTLITNICHENVKLELNQSYIKVLGAITVAPDAFVHDISGCAEKVSKYMYDKSCRSVKEFSNEQCPDGYVKRSVIFCPNANMWCVKKSDLR